MLTLYMRDVFRDSVHSSAWSHGGRVSSKNCERQMLLATNLLLLGGLAYSSCT